MKVWYNKVNESRRSVVEVAEAEIRIGRDAANHVVLASPLVSRKHAIVRRAEGCIELTNVGLNSCLVGEREVLGGETVPLEAGVKVRIWPYTLSFEAETAATVSRAELEAHLRRVLAEPLSRIVIGMHDYATGLDLDSLQVTADVAIDGVAAGENLADRFKPTGEGIWQYTLEHPLDKLPPATMTVVVRDRQGNTSRIERKFSVSVK